MEILGVLDCFLWWEERKGLSFYTGVGEWVSRKREGHVRREAFGIDDGAAVDILRALLPFH
jgi:hypothetical protein